MLVAAFVTGPAIVGALFLLGADQGNETVRLTAIFVSLPLLLTGLGIGRRMSDGPRFLWRGVFIFATAGPLLLALAAMPQGLWPRRLEEWIFLTVLGVILGVVSGIVLAVIIGGVPGRRVANGDLMGDSEEREIGASS